MSRPIGVQTLGVTFIQGTDPDTSVNKLICVDGAGVSTPGNLYSVNLSWNGATVGDEIFIWDNANKTASGNKLFCFRVPTTAGSFPAHFPAVGKRAYAGMYLNCILASGTFNIDIGYSNGNG